MKKIIIFTISIVCFSCSNKSLDLERNEFIITYQVSSVDSVDFNIKSTQSGIEYYFTSHSKKTGLYYRLNNYGRISRKAIYFDDSLVAEKKYFYDNNGLLDSILLLEPQDETHFLRILKYENYNSPWISMSLPVILDVKADTVIITPSNVDYFEIVSVDNNIERYDWTLPWFRFDSSKTAKIRLSNRPRGISIDKYNFAFLNEIASDKDSISYETQVGRIFIPTIRVTKNYNNYLNPYLNKKVIW